MSPRLLIAILLTLAGLLIGGATVLVRPVRSQAASPPAGGRPAVSLIEQAYTLDLPSMGVHALPAPVPPKSVPASPFDWPRSLSPNSGAVGVGGAYMSISPDVISQSVPSGLSVVAANWAPGETVALSINGGTLTNVAASATGRFGLY